MHAIGIGLAALDIGIHVLSWSLAVGMLDYISTTMICGWPDCLY